MKAFFYGIQIQWKIDLRNKEIFLIYYLVPLVFFGFMGGIFTSMMPGAQDTLIQSMSVFGITMGGALGCPVALVEHYGSDRKKAYRVGGIPLWVPFVNNLMSALIHLLLMSSVIYFVAPIAYHATVPANLFIYYLKLVLFLMVTLCVGSVIGLLVKKTSKVSVFGQFIFLPSVMISGVMFPSSYLPEPLRIVGKVFPATWGYHLLTVDNIPLNDILALIIILIISLILIMLLLRKARKN